MQEVNEQIHKYFLGELSSQEQSELFHLLKKNSSVREDFTKQQNLYALLDLLPHQEDFTKGQKSYLDFISKERKAKPRNLLLATLKYVATIAVLISSTWWLTTTVYQNNLETEMNTLYVPPGQRACLTLHDGTIVWLNARSTLTYPSRFSNKEREVSLIGEAFFDVSKNPDAPFTVAVKDISVKVFGTEFNVQGYPEAEYVQTSLLTGSVEITNKTNNKTLKLQPNQEVLVKGNNMEISTIKQHAYFLWKDGIYSFEQETFANIIKKLELYYDIKIVVNSPEIYNFVYTGKFRQQDGIDEILRIIQKIHSFNISRDREKHIITLSK